LLLLSRFLIISYIRTTEITAEGAVRWCTILGPLPPLWPMHC